MNYKKGEFFLKALLTTLGIFLVLIAIIVVFSVYGFWMYGAMFAAIALVCVFLAVNNIKWFGFGMYYFKGTTYGLIAILSFAKLFQSGISGFAENVEYLLIGLVSVLEAIHNLKDWFETVKNLGKDTNQVVE